LVGLAFEVDVCPYPDGGDMTSADEGQQRAEPELALTFPRPVSSAASLPLMVELSVPVGAEPEDVFRASMPIYPQGRPSLEVLEEAIRALTEQTIRWLRDAQTAQEDT
jgi:hypothetical protein